MQRTFNFFYAFLLAILGVGVTLMAEEITLTTYYPAPYGAYEELSTTGKTCLATTSGNVGIGTTSPTQELHLYSSAGSPTMTIESDLNTVNGHAELNLDKTNSGAWARVSYFVAGTEKWMVGMNANDDYSIQTPGLNRLYIRASDGSVGIGTGNPNAKLDVRGGIKAVLSSVSGGNTVKYISSTNDVGYDVAEFFEASEEIETGDLLVLDEGDCIKVRKSKRSYEKCIVGIASGSPAILFEGSQLEIAPPIGGFTKGTKPPVALTGRVKCKVSIENGIIEKGDLLTSSSMPGYAMKATDKNRSFGAIIGKALEKFEGGPEHKNIG